MKKPRATITGLTLTLVAITALLSSCLPAEETPPPMATTPPQTATSVPTLTPSNTRTPDPCGTENIEATIQEFDKLSREFSDAFVLAQNTPAAQLDKLIPQMQEIRRRAEYYNVPACLNDLKQYQLGFMNTAIDTTIILYSQFAGEKQITQEQANAIFQQVNQSMAQASDFGNKYTVEMARLLGVTLPAPPPTLTPAVTPAGPTATP